MTLSWQNPAGGLRYHARALSSRRLWAPFKLALGTWLTNFQPRVKRAVLVGPSAAYTFPDAFLAQFSELTVFEPDPVALFLLKRRLRSLGIERVRIEPRDQLLRPLLAGDAGHSSQNLRPILLHEVHGAGTRAFGSARHRAWPQGRDQSV